MQVHTMKFSKTCHDLITQFTADRKLEHWLAFEQD